jgi:hypothetical protein
MTTKVKIQPTCYLESKDTQKTEIDSQRVDITKSQIQKLQLPQPFASNILRAVHESCSYQCAPVDSREIQRKHKDSNFWTFLNAKMREMSSDEMHIVTQTYLPWTTS